MKRVIGKILFVVLGTFLPLITFAAYVPLEPIAGFPTGSNVSLPAFLNRLFDLILQLGAVTAVVMLAIGGFQYMTSEALHGKEKGRERIRNALLGLLLLLGTYLILYTVNPALLNFNLNSVTGTGSAQSPAPTAAATPPPQPVTYNPAVSGGDTGKEVDQNTQVTYTNPDGSIVGIDKASPSCRALVNKATSIGRTVQGQCN